MSKELVNAIADMREEDALALAQEAMEGGMDPVGILAAAREAMDIVGKDGGFILTNGCGIDHAKPANVKAMMEAGLEYGKYR